MRFIGFIATLFVVSASVPFQARGPEPFTSPAPPGSTEPYLAVAPDGRLHMSWLEPAPERTFALRFASHDGTRWSAPRTIRSGADFFVNWADFPSIKALGNNTLAVHWLQRAGARSAAYGVRVSISRDGGATWGAPVTPHRDSANAEHGFVALWPDNGALGVAWLDGRGFDRAAANRTNEMMLLASSISAAGTLAAESQIDPRACDCCQVSAAVTSAGPIITYRDRTADEIRDVVVVRRVAGRWSAPARVHADNWKINACPVNGPAIAADGNRVAVAWFTAPGDSGRVNVAFSSDAGATFSAPARIDEGNPSGRVDIALARDGGALVTWLERTGGDAAVVRARRVSPANALSAPITVAPSSAARASGFPRIAIVGSNAVFAWSFPGPPSEIRLARVSLESFR